MIFLKWLALALLDWLLLLTVPVDLPAPEALMGLVQPSGA